MFAVESYAAVRRFVFVEGNSQREAAKVFGLSRETIAKMCRFSLPPGYTRSKPVAKPKLGLLLPVIDRILAEDYVAPVKQRHTAKRIFERLRDEHGYGGGYTVVKDYVRQSRVRSRETFVPLAHPPGHAQVDFGEAVGVIGGVRQKVHFFCMDLPQSDACFVKAYPAETTEAFLDGHVCAFAFFGGVPLSILYDNTRIAVAKICGDGKRERTQAFTGLVSHHLFADRFGRPGKGNDKGKVEGLVKYARSHFMVPTCYGFQDVVVKGFVDRVVILCGGEEIARHPRCYGEAMFVANPLHYLALIETKPGALDQAAALQDWTLPEDFQHLRHLLEVRMGNKGKREFIQVLRLLEAMPMEVVTFAVKEAIHIGAIGFDAVKQIALARIERRPARLDLEAYPHLPRMEVKTTRATDYASLLPGIAA
ncbi:IS21 family transposase [Sphingobium yanoikuyae]|uniref:IS21 family transposase n=1 Tax=Sphingobium yanoikuyae TaxID=13690 RepID=A0AA43BDF6_SPHYA|nr:IS21 family transposase [Sphingobium yanoikuyae]MDH2132792.1 IS21 family transposase [Sphingobium yanoikuyae]MDH2151810.1 IS21 family transposase [Sphingobium yanoikuyae]MDH2167957.1 IS21 family transposase [Sphingobium yanoikuyae]